MRLRFVALLLLSTAAVAEAQFPRGPRGPGAAGPDYWVGLSYGLFELGSMADGANRNTWNFGYTTQIAATLEKTIQRGIAVGAVAGFASPNLTYTNSALATNTTARADVTQLMATARIGGGTFGFQSSFNLSAGGVQYANFRDKVTNAKLPGGGWDPAFGTGYSFGLNVTPETEIYIGSDLLFVLHSQGDQVQSTVPHAFTFKLGFRQGF
jgi:hypothetical protein